MKHTFVFTTHAFVFTTHTFVFTKRTFVFTKHTFVFTKHTFVCTEHTFVFPNMYEYSKVCIGKVLRCIERRSQHGFTCSIGGHQRLLFPRLGAMTLDTVERAKYFGLRSYRACATCRLRKGRSCARQSTRHDPDVLNNYFRWANSNARDNVSISQRAKARKKLAHHGFKYKTPCLLHEYAYHCLVHVPEFPKLLFGGTCTYERMHAYYIAFCEYATDMLVASVRPDQHDRIEQLVRRCHQFRDPTTGVTHPRIHSILKMTHLTAERRVRSIFYWAHILGPKAECIVEVLRTPALVVVSTLQLMLISMRGHRSYSQRELETIFFGVGTQFFRALETLAAHHETIRLRRASDRYNRDPDNNRRPLPFKRLRRSAFVFQEHTFVFYTHLPFITHICLLETHICLSQTHMCLSL